MNKAQDTMEEAFVSDVTDPNITGSPQDNIKPISRKQLSIGSDVEIAQRLRKDLEHKYGKIVFTEGECWYYDQTHWKSIQDYKLRCSVHIYDGAKYTTPSEEPANVKLGKSRVDSVVNEMKALIAAPNFFSQNNLIGINCASGYIRFAADGKPSLAPHNPDYLCRHVLPGHWHEGVSPIPAEGSMLHHLITGIFKGDEDAGEKIELIAEGCGAAACGYGTKLLQPRALILLGQKAENGKGQVLALYRGVLPASAVCTISPSRMGDDRHIVGLAGKLLNATDELSSAKAISSDVFKTIITGEPVQGRDVYKTRVEFRPVALHVMATNELPIFDGGMDRGVQRRLLVVTFNRIIPENERIENIGDLIAKEEADILLAWAVGGASRLIRQRLFTMPPSSKIAMNDWLFSADVVLAWIYEKVREGDLFLHKTRTRDAYIAFRNWAVSEGFEPRSLPPINIFVKRVSTHLKGAKYRRVSEGAYFYGMIIA